MWGEKVTTNNTIPFLFSPEVCVFWKDVHQGGGITAIVLLYLVVVTILIFLN